MKPIALQAAVSLHERLFQPTHATVVIVGDVTPAEVDASVLRLFGAWKETVTVPKNTSPAPPRNGPRLAVLNHRGWAQRHGAVFARGPLPTSDDMEAFELLAKVLGGGIASTLFDHLRESGAAYAVGGAVEVRREATWISLVGSYDALKAVTGVSDVLAAVDGARRGSPSDQEISLARETLLADWRASMATVEGSAERYATAIGLGVGVDRAREYPARVLRLGKEDLVRVARAYMAPEVLHVAFLGDDRWLDAEQLGMGGATTLSARP